MPRHQLVYPELSYRIVGLLFQIYNELGFGYQEKYYQRAFAAALKNSGLLFKREEAYPIDYQTTTIGKYFVDFIVDEKIAVELKVSRGVYRRHLTQMLAYLKHTNLKLGILAVFTPDGVISERIVN